MRPRIYLSGPMEGGKILANVARAIAVYRRLIDAGFAPLCPHLNYYADPPGDVPHAVWMEVDLPWVEVADAIVRLLGESPGSDLEEARARALGIPLFTSFAELRQHFKLTTENSLPPCPTAN